MQIKSNKNGAALTLFLAGELDHHNAAGARVKIDALLEDKSIMELALDLRDVRRYMNLGTEYDDLYKIGCMGLVKAIRNFDTAYTVRF